MSNMNLDLLGGAASRVHEPHTDVRAPTGHHWLEPIAGGISHLQRTDELLRTLCGSEARAETNIRNSVPRSTTCRACTEAHYRNQQGSLL
jgi:hypothetical protein